LNLSWNLLKACELSILDQIITN